MNALVTGGNGFIASFLIERLLADGIRVTALVRPTSDLRWIQDLPVKIVKTNWHDFELDQAVVDQDFLFHLAGVTKAKNKQGYWQGNVEITRRLLNSCERVGSQNLKFVFISSQAAAGPSFDGLPVTEEHIPKPISLYGKSKLAAEKLVLEFSQNRFATIIRPPSVYGPRDRDVYMYLKSISKGFVLSFADGDQTVSMIHVFDLVEGIVLAAQHPGSRGKIFFLSGDDDFNALKQMHIFNTLVSRKKRVIHVPLWVVNFFSWVNIAWAAIKGRPALLNRDKINEIKEKNWIVSSERAKKELGFSPAIKLEKGLLDTFVWYQQMGWF